LHISVIDLFIQSIYVYRTISHIRFDSKRSFVSTGAIYLSSIYQ